MIFGVFCPSPLNGGDFPHREGLTRPEHISPKGGAGILCPTPVWPAVPQGGIGRRGKEDGRSDPGEAVKHKDYLMLPVKRKADFCLKNIEGDFQCVQPA